MAENKDLNPFHSKIDTLGKKLVLIEKEFRKILETQNSLISGSQIDEENIFGIITFLKKIKTNTFDEVNNNLKSESIDLYSSLVSSLILLINLFGNKHYSVSELDSNYHTVLQDYQSMYVVVEPILTIGSLKASDKEAKEVVKEIKEARKVTKSAAKDTSVGEFAHLFDKNATDHKNASRWWLVSFVVLSALLIILAICFFNADLSKLKTDNPDIDFQYLLIYKTSIKILFISLAFFLITFCSKNYISNKHNYVINNHRATALKTYKSLAIGLKDTEKEEILRQAANAIFSHQNSGYGTKDTGGGFSLPMLDMLKK